MNFSKELLGRLLRAKQILRHGIEHGDKGGEINRLFSIISLDGAIESFLFTIIVELGAEIKNPRNATFYEIFKAADDAVEKVTKIRLPLKTEIDALHETRNNAQHKGVIPSVSSMERFLVYSSDFLRESCKLCFNLSLDEIYLTDAILDAVLQKIMKQSEESMQKKEYENSVENSAWAFAVLIREKQKYEGWRKKIGPFFQFELNDICRGLAFENNRRSEPKLKEMFISIISEIEYLRLFQSYVMALIHRYSEIRAVRCKLR